MNNWAYIGEIRLFSGNFAPAGWAFCDGQKLPTAGNESLFTILGTTYSGDGDGRTTFNLPDLRGRVPVHPGTGGGLSQHRLGENGGSESTTLTTASVPPSSTVTVNTTDGTTAAAAPASGSGQPLSNMQPYTCINYIICLDGLYPSRN